MSERTTIFALSSGALPSGVAVIRLSGPDARFVLETIAGPLPVPRRAVVRRITAADGGEIDRGLVLWLPGPASFTGEDMAEIQVHGGRAVVAALVERLGGLPGLRLAEAGEFTRRAFVHGKLDLAEAEGIADLIAAETEMQRRQAIRQAGGVLGRLTEGWRRQLIEVRAQIEAELDFPDEDDVPGSASDAAWALAATVEAEIARQLDDGGRGERLRTGLEILLMGPPNAGKSSLFNRLAGREAAIVTSEPGTTRDLIELRLDLGGVPVTLVDSAGLREAEGAIEREGIRRARDRAAAADLVLWLEAADAAEAAEPPELDGGPAIWRIGTKADLPAATSSAGGRRHTVSAVTGSGLDGLVSDLQRFAAERAGAGEAAVITRARHRAALEDTVAALRRALNQAGSALELRAEEIRVASDALGRITGRIGVEDVLDVVFSSFCIGK